MRWFGLSFAPFSKYNERFARQYRCKPPPEFQTATDRHRHKQTDTQTQTHAETHTQKQNRKHFYARRWFWLSFHCGPTTSVLVSPQDVFGGTQTSTLSSASPPFVPLLLFLFSMFSFDLLSCHGSVSAQNLSVIASEINSRNSRICFCNGN